MLWERPRPLRSPATLSTAASTMARTPRCLCPPSSRSRSTGEIGSISQEAVTSKGKRSGWYWLSVPMALNCGSWLKTCTGTWVPPQVRSAAWMLPVILASWSLFQSRKVSTAASASGWREKTHMTIVVTAPSSGWCSNAILVCPFNLAPALKAASMAPAYALRLQSVDPVQPRRRSTPSTRYSTTTEVGLNCEALELPRTPLTMWSACTTTRRGSIPKAVKAPPPSRTTVCFTSSLMAPASRSKHDKMWLPSSSVFTPIVTSSTALR
mmetsp:Transcript_96507/g.270097  ORF Transcript_96507/g.270097 Transcript_96507/m.270097 type:complete len:267 (-) Transcript_96507:716-1516(-)